MTRHSKDDALTERQFVLLLKACRKIDDPETEFQSRLALLCAGKLGMRVGEISHLSAEWINERQRTIEIPRHDRCTKMDGRACGYCRNRARSHVSAMNISHEEAVCRVKAEVDAELSDDAIDELAQEKQKELAIQFDEALERWWRPKTAAGAREIPYDWDVRVNLAIEEFLERYEAWPTSQSTINRRINKVVELSPVNTRVYPHCLRATAASYHAARDVSAASLMAIMGWSSLEIARSYISASAEKAAKEVRSKHR